MLLVILALALVAGCMMKATCTGKPKAKHRAPLTAAVVVKSPESEALRARTAVENAARRVYES